MIGFHFYFPNSKITRRITKTRKNESTKKCSLLCEWSPHPAQAQPHQQRTKPGLAPSFEVPVPILFPTAPTANKTGTGSELRGACPAFVPNLTNSEQNRDWLRASRCLSRFCSVKQRTNTDQPAPVEGSGGDPFSIHSELSKIIGATNETRVFMCINTTCDILLTLYLSLVNRNTNTLS